MPINDPPRNSPDPSLAAKLGLRPENQPPLQWRDIGTDRVANLIDAKLQEYDAPERNLARVAGMWRELFGWDVKPIP